MNWNIFKHQMQLLREYRFCIEDLENEREDTFYFYYGVHGVSFDRIPSSHSPEMDMNKREKFNRKIEDIDRQIKAYRESVEQYEATLRRLPKDAQNMARRKFLDGYTYYKLGKEFGYSPTGARKHIQIEVEKI